MTKHTKGEMKTVSLRDLDKWLIIVMCLLAPHYTRHQANILIYITLSAFIIKQIWTNGSDYEK